MSRRPIHLAAADRSAQARQDIWDAIRASGGKPFTISALGLDAIPPRTVRSYLACLVAGGILSRIEREAVLQWRLDRDAGFYAPRLNKHGETVTQGLGVEQMWRTMRMLTEFDAEALALHASTDDVGVALGTAKAYIKVLFAAGYLRCTHKGTRARLARYRLIRNSGPIAPQVQRIRQVFDPNSGEVFPTGDLA